MTTAEALRAAKAEQERRGWMQNPPQRQHPLEDGPCCAAQAINSVPYLVGPNDPFAVFAAALGIDKTGSAFWLAVWNDAPGRTQEEVMAAFDKAIAIAEGSAE